MKYWLGIILGLCTLVQGKPNIILIMADDVSWEAFGAYGGEDYKTPNIDALAAKGIRFTQCYSTPICTPSRVQIMTGRYSFRNYTHFGYLNPKDKTFGNLMKQAGYKTAIAGKWQLNGLYNSLPGHADNTLADLAGVKLGKGDPIDGQSFLPQLLGKLGTPRDFVLCHYQPYWNKIPGQFARTAKFKLYRDGRFYAPAADLKETKQLAHTAPDYLKLKRVLEACPPAPKGKAGRNTKNRPIYPDWNKINLGD